tara:strand:- start:871 stop:1995 length:1125 start_codon:yes stop_codon:yes gene_type:complete
MSEMQAVYEDELSGGSGGLMSLMRGIGDFTLGEDIMNNLPEISAMLRNTNKDTLTMRQTQEMGKPSEISVTLSNTPGLESLLSDTEFDLGNLDPMFAGTTANPQDLVETLMMVGPGKKIGMADDGMDMDSFKKLIADIQKKAEENRLLQSKRDMAATRKENDPDRPQFLKSFDQIRREEQDARDQANLDKALGSLMKNVEADKAKRPLEDPKGFFDDLTKDGFNISERDLQKSRLMAMSREERYNLLDERQKMIVNAKRDSHRKIYKELFGPDREPMTDATEQKLLAQLEKLEKDLDPFFPPTEFFAGGGRPGLYANIAAKRRRIKAGSGEKMRKPGSEGAPTKENFRQAETTAKKAAGGALSYAKGYYGKSYK